MGVLLASILTLGAAEYSYRPVLGANPLKGFLPYAGTYSFPHSLEWVYFPLSAIQTDFEEFRWSFFEKQLNAVAARGHQCVFRTYLDYPNLPYGMPAFLAQVPKHAYTDYDNGTTATSFSPDYENADLRRALRSFISALGARYDGDPRIGFITVGLLGFWGEWHTYPHTGADGTTDWFASSAVQKEILDAFTQSFHRTKFLVREPKDGLDFRQWPVGYHDDSFAFQTLAPVDWHFWPRIVSKGLQDVWKTEPIGGEVRPEIQLCMWEPGSTCVPTGQEYPLCVRTTHASWMLDQQVFNSSFPAALKSKALEGSRQLGYEFALVSGEIPSRVSNGTLNFGISVTNTGVAPFYYPWPVHIGWKSASGLALEVTNDWDLRRVQPENPAIHFRQSVRVDDLAPGDYRLLMSVPNPLPTGLPLRFANQEQDADEPGWMSLGAVRMGPPPRILNARAEGARWILSLGDLGVGWNYRLEGTRSIDLKDWEAMQQWKATTKSFEVEVELPLHSQEWFLRIVEEDEPPSSSLKPIR